MIEIIKTKHYRIDLDKECRYLRLIFFSSRLGYKDTQNLIEHLKKALLIGEINFVDVERESPDEKYNGRNGKVD